jgi:hypothetical protein
VAENGAITNWSLKTYKAKTILTVRSKDYSDNWGRKRCAEPNGFERFPNRHAKILTGGTHEGVLANNSPAEKMCTYTYRCVQYILLPTELYSQLYL